MDKLRFHVPAMSCMHCVRAIERELSAVPGVSQVEVRLEPKTVTVSFVPPADAATLRDRLAKLGYPAQD
ncbi:MAG: heavy-metal-associated domain-containing protein [Myxococcales bacterium]|nr:heavy-metal-associated domain-containing protein [Myxococcales bacterium]